MPSSIGSVQSIKAGGLSMIRNNRIIEAINLKSVIEFELNQGIRCYYFYLVYKAFDSISSCNYNSRSKLLI